MTVLKRDQLKLRFKNGMYPTESDFADGIDSFVHKTEDTIPISAVDGLPEQLNSKFPASAGAALKQQADQIRADLTTHEESNHIQFADIDAQQTNQDAAIARNAQDIESIREDLAKKEHFRGYYGTNAEIQALASPETGDYAYSAESGTKWAYNGAAWEDTTVPVPDQTVPASDDIPLMDGTPSPGMSNEYARGDHRHPKDSSKANENEVVKLKESNQLTGDNTFAGKTSYAKRDYIPTDRQEFANVGLVEDELNFRDKKIDKLQLRSNLTPETIIVDEIPKVKRFFVGGNIEEAVMISLNRPVNYTFFTQKKIYLALAELKWMIRDGQTSIKSSKSLDNGASFYVNQDFTDPEGPMNRIEVNVDTPIAKSVQQRIIYLHLPAGDNYTFARLDEADSDGRLIKSTDMLSARSNGVLALILNNGTASIRVNFELLNARLGRFAIYINSAGWRSYAFLTQLQTGLYRKVLRDPFYEPIHLSKVPRILNKAHTLIATPQYGGGYTLAKYYPPIENLAEVLYGKQVNNPGEAFQLIEPSTMAVGVFVKLKCRRNITKYGDEPREGTTRHEHHWALYTGISRSMGLNYPSTPNPFPPATEVWKGVRNPSYFYKMYRDSSRMVYVDCVLAYIHTSKKGVEYRPVGGGIRFRLYNRKLKGPRHGTNRGWYVDRI